MSPDKPSPSSCMSPADKPRKGRQPGSTAFSDGNALAKLLQEEIKGAAQFKVLEANQPKKALAPNKDLWRKLDKLAPKFWIQEQAWKTALDAQLEDNAIVKAALRNADEEADWVITNLARLKSHSAAIAAAQRRHPYMPAWCVELLGDASGATAESELAVAPAAEASGATAESQAAVAPAAEASGATAESQVAVAPAAEVSGATAESQVAAEPAAKRPKKTFSSSPVVEEGAEGEDGGNEEPSDEKVFVTGFDYTRKEAYRAEASTPLDKDFVHLTKLWVAGGEVRAKWPDGSISKVDGLRPKDLETAKAAYYATKGPITLKDGTKLYVQAACAKTEVRIYAKRDGDDKQKQAAVFHVKHFESYRSCSIYARDFANEIGDGTVTLEDAKAARNERMSAMAAPAAQKKGPGADVKQPAERAAQKGEAVNKKPTGSSRKKIAAAKAVKQEPEERHVDDEPEEEEEDEEEQGEGAVEPAEGAAHKGKAIKKKPAAAGNETAIKTPAAAKAVKQEPEEHVDDEPEEEEETDDEMLAYDYI